MSTSYSRSNRLIKCRPSNCPSSRCCSGGRCCPITIKTNPLGQYWWVGVLIGLVVCIIVLIWFLIYHYRLACYKEESDDEESQCDESSSQVDIGDSNPAPPLGFVPMPVPMPTGMPVPMNPLGPQAGNPPYPIY